MTNESDNLPKGSKSKPPFKWLILLSIGLFLIILGYLVTGVTMVGFSPRAKMTEAKTNLQVLHALQSDYLNNNNRYTDNLVEIQFNQIVEPNALYRYKYGFVKKSKSPHQLPDYSNSDQFGTIKHHDFIKDIPFESFYHHCPDCIVTPKTFKAMAVGNVDDDPTLDIWTINHKKELVHLLNDLEE